MRRRRRTDKAPVAAIVAALLALAAPDAAAGAYWFFQGNLGYPLVTTRVTYNDTPGTQYARITWNGHYLYGCNLLIYYSGTWDSRCKYTADTDGDYEITFNPNTYNQAGCRNPPPQQYYWANCHHSNGP
jgi:hypothetical protein